MYVLFSEMENEKGKKFSTFKKFVCKMETEVQLLELLITAESKTRTAFAELIGMSRQNINYLIRKAEKNNGKLNEDFKELLKENNLDLYKFKRNPTADFYSTHKNYQTQPETPMILAEEQMLMNDEIIRLLKDKVDLLGKLHDQCSQERDTYKKLLEAGLPLKKTGRRHSA